MLPSRSTRSIRRRFSTRPAVAAVLLVALITALAVFRPVPAVNPLAPRQARARRSLAVAGGDVLRGDADIDCRQVHHAADQCAFVLANCEDDEAGLLHYLTFYYCTLGSARPVAFAILALWLGLLFTTIGIAASDFFSVNLSTIAGVLGLSESLAGVTFLAFGNGSPDVFSTFAAMGSNSGSMAVGELIGAASFITAVVAGSMALVREFKVSKRTFVRDIVFFIVAIIFTMGFLADGELHLWECFTMIGYYLFYVAVVVGWHWLTARRRRRRARDVAARAHLYAAAGAAGDELEPYRDDPDEDEAAPVGRSAGGAAEPGDISALERGPRIEVDGVPGPVGHDDDDDDDADSETRDILVAAEMASSMRVNRPRWSRSNTTTISPIRPSLMGVLEFRSVLSSLQKERNMQLGPLHGRPHSAQQPATGAHHEDPRGRPRTKTMPAQAPPRLGERSLSYGSQSLSLGGAGPSRADAAAAPAPQARASSVTRTVDGLLAPPLGAAPAVDPAPQDLLLPDLPDQRPRVRIPSPSGRSSGQSSPSISPFPRLSESPAPLSPLPDQTTFQFPASPDTPTRRQSFPGLDDQGDQPRPVRWWPYSLLPAPHVLLATVFPTLQGWREKTLWDKAVSLLSVPSIFLLVVTLPVVESESEHDGSEDGVADPPERGHLGHTAPAVSVEDGADIQPETEWQAYRRRARSATSQSPLSRSPSSRYRDYPSPEPRHSPSIQVPQLAKPPAAAADSDAATAGPGRPADAAEWNRWLVALQLFTGPLFVVFILWANTAEETANPGRALLRMVLYSLVVSLCLLAALLLTTSPDRKPRYHFLLCFLGFVISVAWISTIAGEVVGVLKAFGVMLDISEAILGLTVFAVGNSLGDLVADVTIARLGYPVMALAACFGGPMLNILLGIGIGGAWMGITAADNKHRKHPDRPLRYKPYRIQVGGTLMVSAATVLLTLVVLLVVVPRNGWVMSRRIGWGLISIWTVGTVVSLVVEMTGTWSDVS